MAPLLQLKGLHIGAGRGLAIGEAEVLVSMYSGLPGRSLTERACVGWRWICSRMQAVAGRCVGCHSPPTVEIRWMRCAGWASCR